MKREVTFLCAGMLVSSLTLSQPAFSQTSGKPGDRPSSPPVIAPVPPMAGNARSVTINIPVNSDVSLVHVGSSDSFAITAEGRQAATLLLSSLEEPDEQKSREEAKKASAIYDQIIPRENYGGEYSALQWFADYITADTTKQPEFLQDPQVAFFFHVFSSDDFAVLKEYLMRKYRLREIGDEETKAGQDRKIWLEDTVLFENPRREAWERTSQLMKLLEIHPGEKIADVGSGPGYFSFRFAKAVGPSGHVFSIEMNGNHLRYIEQAKTAMGVENITTVETDGKSVGLGGFETKVDAVFLCSLYHNMYAMATKPERDSFIGSIKETLKPDGRLYLVDNGLVPPGTLPYHGPYVAKELIIAQMLNYGFDLERQSQHIPQRYLLVFKVKKDDVGDKPVAATPGQPETAAAARTSDSPKAKRSTGRSKKHRHRRKRRD